MDSSVIPDEGWIPFRASNCLGTYPAQAQYSFYVPLHGTFKFIISVRKNRRKGNVFYELGPTGTRFVKSPVTDLYYLLSLEKIMGYGLNRGENVTS